MKRVRFETPTKSLNYVAMNDFECQTPRPFIEKKIIPVVPDIKYEVSKILPFNKDPLQRYECGNGSPYPMINKTRLTELTKIEPTWSPSNDLELSLLDSCMQVTRRNNNQELRVGMQQNEYKNINPINNGSIKTSSQVLTSLENKSPNPIISTTHDNFFLQRENLQEMFNQTMQPPENQFKKLSLDKENYPMVAKNEFMKIGVSKPPTQIGRMSNGKPIDPIIIDNEYCKCHHCRSTEVNNGTCNKFHLGTSVQRSSLSNVPIQSHFCVSQQTLKQCVHCDCNIHVCNKFYKQCPCDTERVLPKHKNEVDKKTWALKKYEESQGTDTMDVEKQGSMKEKREPTVTDLFKIIKLQNEQLQLLQDKVDKFMSASKLEEQKKPLPVQKILTEHVAVETIDKEHHKISIGVMTSFEMVRTSTIINKGIMKQSSEAQIQCNRSQISIKEVQPTNLNFLDGITPAIKNNDVQVNNSMYVSENNKLPHEFETWQKENENEEKTFNEMSLYNVQVDNATTPLMSPEQSLYLDVRDYSDSEPECEDQSNVGWTYYNKVMTHVNGMLHDSDMPSSASALYRHTQQKCMQMKIDKSNVSVIKRVKFGDDPIGIQQQYMIPSTDTSLKMNQLAAKYLKNGPLQTQEVLHKPPAPVDMSFATRNYMEKHQLLQGLREQKSKPTTLAELPRFLDITALKKQPKFL